MEEIVSQAKLMISKPFLEVLVFAAWNIWKQRNAKVPDSITLGTSSWFSNFKRGLFFLTE